MNWEWVLGGNWLARIGVLAVIIGTAFFLKLSFDNDWIGETTRVVLGVVGGLVMLGGGEYWRQRYPTYAQALAGGGVALQYLSIFAAFALYELIAFYPAVGLLFAISVGSTLLALRHESMSLGILGIAGAFMAPFIVGATAPEGEDLEGKSEALQLIGYIVVVDLGVLALSTFRNWRWLTLLGLLASLATYGLWYADHNETVGLLTSQASLTLIFLIFVSATTLFHVLWRQAPREFDQALIVINAAAYFGISYGILWDDYRAWMGGFTVLLALFYGGIGSLLLLRGGEQLVTGLMTLGVAVVFLTIAVPVQLGGPWVSVAWAVESVVLLWLAFRLDMPQMRIYGVGVFAVFALWLLLIDSPEALSADVTPFWNEYFPAYLISIAATYLSAFLMHRNRDRLYPQEQYLFPVFLTTANVFLTVAVPVQVGGEWITVTWAAEALVLMWLAFRLDFVELRLFGLGLLGSMAVRLIVFDTPVDLADFRLVLNHRMLAFASGIAALYVSAYLWRKNAEPSRLWEVVDPVPIFLASASLLTLWVLSAEVIAAVDSGVVDVSDTSARSIKSLSLSLLWAGYASALLAVGIVKKWRLVRLGGLALLAVPIAKLFLVDTFELDRGYRVAAFLSLGVLLLVGGFLYQRYGSAIREFLFEEQRLPDQV